MWNNEDLHAHFSKNKSGLRETDFFFNGTFKSTFMEISYFCQFFAKLLALTRKNPFLIVLIESIMCNGTIIYQDSTKHSYSPMTVFIILTLKIQLSVIIRCRLAQLNMDLQKATCLRTIQNLEFTIPKKTSKAGSVDGQPCKYSSLAERPPWLPLY